VPDEVLDKVQHAVDAGGAANVSAYFTRLAEREPDWATARQVVSEMVARIGGVSEDDVAWAEQTLGLHTTVVA
jgi:hypothetical protein